MMFFFVCFFQIVFSLLMMLSCSKSPDCLLMGMFFSSFFLQLRGSNDGFSVVADYFGRGVFNKLTLVTDPPGSKSGSLEVNLQRDLLINTKRNC